MKKLLAITAALALALGLAACASGASSASSSSSGTSGSSASSASSATSGSSASLANPWTDAHTATEAAEAAGVGTFELPEVGTKLEGGPVDFAEFRSMDLLAEAVGYVGAANLVVRKGVKNPDRDPGYDTADVSGDYNAYAHEWVLDAADWKVKCFGNEEGRTMKAIWQSDNFSYSILVRGQGDIHDTYGLGADDITALVGTIA